ncbi:plasmalemma vesicle associated protein a isoform X3 [Labrus mixtus]|uniref:plasmalemma vesicle associated protein a isoform X2 n=1 Tax=Labrus mixtus TaxID=508554 RepID=UPI0029BFCFB3|nr:plasmalemma vesicle associated protein a isoform X2 [Labrus mixtus]XP_060900320.1 plasmalemma vesicle associated protein a isoform X3 [Labrus mixtus]
MYSSGYSHVSKYSQEARKKMKHRSKGKSCGYYMRIVFFFSSLIQSLIIVSLVLFLIYGKDQDSASTSRIHHLEESFSSLSIENVALKQQRKNLTTFLNATLIEKARNDWDLAKLREYTNTSVILIQDMQKRLVQCNGELMTCKMGCIRFPPPSHVGCNCGPLMEQMRAKLQLEKANFTQIVQRMRMDMEETAKERDKINLEAIHLRREKSTHVKEVEYFKQKCKDDFTMSLSGVSSVSSAFLQKIDSLFPTHIAFQLTCPKQREHLEQIRTNCSSLSREVEDRFQRYLNSVGDQVSSIQAESSRMKAENWRLSEDYRWCSQNRTSLIQQNRYNQDKLQLKHDQEKEKLLIDKMKLNGEIELLEHNVNYKSKEVEHLLEQIKVLNMSCMSKTGFSTFPAGTHQSRMSSPFGMGSPSQFNKLGSGSSSSFGSSGSAFNKPVSTGSGYSLLGSGSSTGFGSNKPASTGLGSSSSSGSSLLGSGSSTGFGSNKPASTGSGSSSSSGSSLFGSSSSTGFGSNKPASTGSGSSSSSGSSLFGSRSNKPASTGSGSSSSSGSSLFGSSSSTGLGSNKPASTSKGSSSTSWFGFGGSSSGQSKTGSGTGKETSSGSGSSFGSGRTSSFGGGSVNVAQHLRDLQRLINSPTPEEKQDLSRVLG